MRNWLLTVGDFDQRGAWEDDGRTPQTWRDWAHTDIGLLDGFVD